jgi:NDP-sugar pyrophosphorylase family protein
VFGHVLDGEWFDIGDLESYRRADEAMARREAS